ncbi:hypothetical protein NM208_g8411 [Fusarium decemcellulare]|uniref:Uncharacterized protein n=1 Tax=Fusarium decemcellulare TaxID=57161 RepID=A0ACC1S5E9_9HYPO|nr:hypothetical protein NM208_g8411 [Fusarium decemcellulare]
MSTPRLESLPTEILHQICVAICSHCTKRRDYSRPWDQLDYQRFTEHRRETKSLRNLCLVSRRMNQVATPPLYHFFLEPTMDTSKTSWQRLLAALDTFAKRPNLALHVKHVIMGGRVSLDASNMPLVHQIARGMGVALPENWQDPGSKAYSRPFISLYGYETHEDRVEEARCVMQHSFLVDLFLRSTGRLECLDLAVDHQLQIGKTFSPWTTLNALKELHLRFSSIRVGRWLGFECVAGILLRAPNLQVLKVSGKVLPITFPDLQLKNLRHLEFCWCNLDWNDLRNMLRCCNELDTFIFSYPYHPDRGIPTPTRLITELTASHPALKRLEITERERCLYSQNPQDIIAPTSFKALTELTHLRLDGFPRYSLPEREDPVVRSTLLDLLPPSLQVITLEKVSQNGLQVVQELVQQGSLAIFPNLTKLLVYGSSLNNKPLGRIEWTPGSTTAEIIAP